MTTAFEPADGVKARWRHCDELVDSLEPGDGIEYGQIEELLGCDRVTAQQAMSQCKKNRERDGKRSFATKDKYGWVILSADGHLAEGDKYYNRLREVAKRRVHVLGSANNYRDELTPERRRELDIAVVHARALSDIASRRKTSVSELLAPRRPEL